MNSEMGFSLHLGVTGIGTSKFQIDRHAHRQIAHPVRVELVARAASGAFRDEFGAHAARLWIEYHGIEIGHPVKQAARADELVERLALGVLFWRTVIGVGAPERRGGG